ncbi:MAG: hypothetical protein H6682_16480 [Candidatus Eisenbacteria bacterium]|nr:hypothetical protein [Candidatus Eisenbacteria bacterium]
MSPKPHERALGRWTPALLLTLLLHLGAAWGFLRFDLFGADDTPSKAPEFVEVVFAAPDQPRPDPMNTFTELPDDRADEPAERPDFLSNVDSRARDLVPGGEDRISHQEGRAQFPQVAMDAGEPSAPSDPTPPSPQTDQSEFAESDESQKNEATEAEDAEVRDREAPEDAVFEQDTPPPLEEDVVLRAREPDPWAAFRRASAAPPPSPNSPASTPQPGGPSDLAQDAMSSPEANAELLGDISLNTKEWEWAPWLQAFRRELMEKWTAPLGYHLGLIHGWTLLEVVIAPSGQVLSNRVLDEEGNVAFREASLAAVDRSQPYLPLPDDFPEEALVITLRLDYPEWEKVVAPPPEPAQQRRGRRR